jgi:hypothetical protein
MGQKIHGDTMGELRRRRRKEEEKKKKKKRRSISHQTSSIAPELFGTTSELRSKRICASITGI